MTRRILCIEDDPSIAELVGEVLTEAGYEVDIAASGTQAIRLIGNGHHALICDIDLPGPSGLDVLRAVRERGSEVPFVLVTAFTGRDNQIEARRLGCDDFLGKPIDFELLLAVLDNVVGRKASGGAREGSPSSLTEREREIMSWVAQGKSSADIAQIVGISERTVNFHVDRVLRKLDVATRMQAAIACVRLGWIDA